MINYGYSPHPQRPPLASGGSRIGSLLLDGLAGLGVYVVMLAAFGAGAIEWGIALGLLGGLSLWVYQLVGLGRGQTIGMRAVGIWLVDQHTLQPVGAGRAFGRQLAAVLSAMPCYLGFFWGLWDRNHQTWHDKMLGTIVITQPAGAFPPAGPGQTSMPPMPPMPPTPPFPHVGSPVSPFIPPPAAAPTPPPSWQAGGVSTPVEREAPMPPSATPSQHPPPAAPAYRPSPPSVPEQNASQIDASHTIARAKLPATASGIGAPPSPSARRLTLSAEDGSLISIEGRTVLGREPSAIEPGDKVLRVACAEFSVSARHLLAYPDGQGWMVSDLGSTNGSTIANGGAVRRLGDNAERLVVGDVLSLGVRSFMVQAIA